MDIEQLKKNPEKIKELIMLLSSLIETETITEVKQKDQEEEMDDSSWNKFNSMSIKNMYQSDIEIDKKLSNNTPTERNRRSSKMQVTCRSCNKTEEVSSSCVLTPDRYKCNKCIRSNK